MNELTDEALHELVESPIWKQDHLSSTGLQIKALVGEIRELRKLVQYNFEAAHAEDEHKETLIFDNARLRERLAEIRRTWRWFRKTQERGHSYGLSKMDEVALKEPEKTEPAMIK